MRIRKKAATMLTSWVVAGWVFVFVGAQITINSAEAKREFSNNLSDTKKFVRHWTNKSPIYPGTIDPGTIDPEVFFDSIGDEGAMAKITETNGVKLPTEIEILLWNVQKGEGKADFKKDFLYLSQDKTLIAIQEFLEDGIVDDTIKLVPDFEFWAARSFFTEEKRTPTGVATGAIAAAVRSQFLRSEDTEPIADTPKMTLITDYQMENGENLKVINTHGINFTTTAALRRQLEAVYKAVRDYSGKMIWMGDFNTWNRDRFEILQRVTTDLGLHKIKFDTDPRTFEFDHLFYRGCKMLSAFVLNQIVSSDHYPIYATLDCQ